MGEKMGGIKCSLCGETFDDAEELAEHIKEAHSGADVENYECSICGSRFETKEDLISHMSGAHSQNVS